MNEFVLFVVPSLSLIIIFFFHFSTSTHRIFFYERKVHVQSTMTDAVRISIFCINADDKNLSSTDNNYRKKEKIL